MDWNAIDPAKGIVVMVILVCLIMAVGIWLEDIVNGGDQ